MTSWQIVHSVLAKESEEDTTETGSAAKTSSVAGCSLYGLEDVTKVITMWCVYVLFAEWAAIVSSMAVLNIELKFAPPFPPKYNKLKIKSSLSIPRDIAERAKLLRRLSSSGVGVATGLSSGESMRDLRLLVRLQYLST